MPHKFELSRTVTAAIFVILSVITALFIIFGCVEYRTDTTRPVAVEGEIDLSTWNFSNNTVPLVGEWTLNGHEHYKSIPSTFEPGVNSETYQLTLNLPAYNDDMALEIPYLPSSSSVYINGHKFIANGIYSDTGNIEWKDQIISLVEFNTPIVVEVKVANYGEYFLGGLTTPIKIGNYSTLSFDKTMGVLKEFAYIVVFILYGLFHMSFIRGNNRATLWMGLYCIQIAGYVLFWQERHLLSLFDYDWEFFQRINFGLIYTGVLCFWLHSQANHFRPWVSTGTKVVAGIVSALVIVAVVAPIEIVSNTFVYVFAPMLLISSTLKAYIFFDAYIKKGGIWLVNFLGYSVLAIFAINDLLNHMEILSTGLWVGEGLLVYLGVQVYIIQSRYNDKFDETEKLNLDLTESYEQLKAAHDSTDLALVQKTQFMAMVGMELRTPILTSYKMLESLEGMDLSKGARTFVRMALEDLEPALILTEDISDISGLKYNQLSIRETSFELLPSLERLIDQFNTTHSSKNVTAELSIDYPCELSKYILTDQIRIHQLISGYFNVTLKNAKPGDKLFVRVQVSPIKMGEKSHTMIIELMDEGPGMDDQLKSKLQSVLNDPSHTNPHFLGSPGMGISMAKHILDRMGGTVSFRSKAGIGTTFKMTIPIDLSDTKDSHPNLTIDTNKDTTILLVESNPRMRMATKSLMAHVGVTVTAVDCALDATLHFERNQFDMVFVDCYLPKVNGFEMTKQIRDIEKLRGLTRTPIIGLYEGNIETVEELALEAKMDSCMSKPLKKDALFKKIQAQNDMIPNSINLLLPIE